MKHLLIILMLFSISVSGQSIYQETYEQPFFKGTYPKKIPVIFRAYPVYKSENSYRIFIPVEIKYNHLQFVRNKDVYEAGAEIEVQFTEHSSGKITSKMWKTELSVSDYKATNDNYKFHFTIDTLIISSGQYDILFKYKDINGSQRLTLKQRLSLKKVDDIYTSPPLFTYPGRSGNRFLDSAKGSPSSLQINWDFNTDMGIFYQVWQKDITQKMTVRVELIEMEEGATVFLTDTVLAENKNRQHFNLTIPAKYLHEGRHRLKTVYYANNDSTRKIIPFDVVWFDKPLSLWNNNLAIEPLQYIIDEEAYKEIASGNKQEQIKKLRAFWEERDPTAETPFNELKKEFYSRVDSTLIRFGTKRTLGWRTDPGKIYISNGTPDKIEDHSLDPIPDPFMRWIYFQEDKKITYTFKAVNGRKEYKLSDTSESRL